jgi:hypothetical protein
LEFTDAKMGKIAELPAELGKVGELLADNGYFSEANVNACAAAGIEPVIAPRLRKGKDGTGGASSHVG